MKKIKAEPCCPGRPELKARSLISSEQAALLEKTFKILANETRLKILHALIRAGELCVTDIAEQVGLNPTTVSNQLQRLADRGIIERKRDGNRIYYCVVDPCVVKLLDSAWCLTEDSLKRTQKKCGK